MGSPPRIVRSVLGWSFLRWPVETQLGSRRNALVASTALTQARREREDVEEFLAARAAAPAGTPAGAGARRDVI